MPGGENTHSWGSLCPKPPPIAFLFIKGLAPADLRAPNIFLRKTQGSLSEPVEGGGPFVDLVFAKSFPFLMGCFLVEFVQAIRLNRSKPGQLKVPIGKPPGLGQRNEMGPMDCEKGPYLHNDRLQCPLPPSFKIK